MGGRQIAHYDGLRGRQILFQFQRLHRARHRQVGVRHYQHARLTGKAGQSAVGLRRQPDDARDAEQRRVRILFRPNQQDRAAVEIRRQALHEGEVHATVDDAEKNDKRAFQTRQFRDRLSLRGVLPEIEIDAVGQQMRRAAHAGNAPLQVLTDGHDDVGAGDDFHFHPLQRLLVQARPLAEIVHAVINPAADG